MLRANDSERNDGLDLRVHGRLLRIVLIVLVWVHPDVVERELLLDAVLEDLAFLEGKRVGLGDDGNHVDGLTELLEHDNIDGSKAVAGRVDEVEAAVDAGVLDVAAPKSVCVLCSLLRAILLTAHAEP